jgi:quinol-cytochrome oxidoreductase complex cytochrome b subunit
MPKNDQYQVRKPMDEEKKKVHPIWRGIGCISMAVIPVLSYIGAVQLLSNRDHLKWIIVPQEIVLKKFIDPMILVKLLYALIIALLLFLILAFITFVINRLFGPSKYGPYDVRD